MDDEQTARTVPVIEPGATIGMVGGGQLGRMFVVAATRLGYQVKLLCEHRDDPAAQLTPQAAIGQVDDMTLVDEFAGGCDVITLEFENIPAATIERCARYAPTYPSAHVLAVAQNRLLEKTTLQSAGLPVTPFARVDGPSSLRDAAQALGWPLIVKTAQSGYDGKGQYRVESDSQATTVPWDSAQGWIAEQMIHFDCELSVIVARTPDGRTSTFPTFENQHANHILDVTTLPARITPDVQQQATSIAISAAETLGVVGILCVELFAVGEQLWINEVAPRPHNSGHLTIEACQTSQFEQHVRAICNLPLGSTKLVAGGAAMANLLGDLWPRRGGAPAWDAALEVPGVQLHLYGKRTAKPGRKMGHLTAVATSAPAAEALVKSARERCGRPIPTAGPTPA